MFKEKMIDIGFQLIEKEVKNEADERKVRSIIADYIEREYAKNVDVSKEEEIDAEGLFEYLKCNYIDDVRALVIECDKNKRGELRTELLEKAVYYSKANTSLSEQRVKRIVTDGINLLKDFYRGNNNYELRFLVTEAEECLSNEIENGVKDIERKIEDSNFMLPQNVAKCIMRGDLNKATMIMSQSASVINDAHCLNPYYGFSLTSINGEKELQSIPLLPEATLQYPPRLEIVPSEIEMDNKQVDQIDIRILRYSYNHQTPIKINVKEAVKYLGDIRDPCQCEAQKITGRSFEIKPKEFPPAFPCSIAIDDIVYFDYILLRTKEILDDGTIVIDNREEEKRRFIVELKLSTVTQSVKINIRVISGKNRDSLTYFEFAYKASLGGEFIIKALNMNEKLAYAHIRNTAESDKLLKNIEILKKVVALEEYFGKEIMLPNEFPMEDYKALNWLYEMIKIGKSVYKWTGYTLTFELGTLKKETILNTLDLPYAMSLTLSMKIELFNLKEDIVVKKMINNLRIKDLDKLKQKVEVLDEDDSIKVKIVPNSDGLELNDCVDKLVCGLNTLNENICI